MDRIRQRPDPGRFDVGRRRRSTRCRWSRWERCGVAMVFRRRQATLSWSRQPVTHSAPHGYTV
jgi:hypothetical protein